MASGDSKAEKDHNRRRQRARQRAYRALVELHKEDFERLLTDELQIEGIQRDRWGVLKNKTEGGEDVSHRQLDG